MIRITFKSLHSSEQLVVVEEAAIQALADLCDGDARVALNGLQLAVQSQVAMAAQKKKTFKTTADKDSITYGESKLDGYQSALTTVRVNVDHIKKGLQRTHLLYDKKGDEHFNSISALHKSIRGSDANAALYWLARMLEGGEDSLYIARRLVRCASEDIGKSNVILNVKILINLALNNELCCQCLFFNRDVSYCYHGNE